MNWRLLAAGMLALGLVGILTVSLLFGLTGGDFPFDHGIVVDAGSTKSELFLYRWQGDKYKDTGCVTQLDSCRKTGGLGSYSDPIMAGKSLLPCLESVMNQIPEDKRKTSVIFLGATAGMRKVNSSNPFLSLAIMTAVECNLKLSGMDVRDVGIMDGESEALFAWVTTNYLLGILQKGEHSTVGALDLGGSSTQVAFEVPPDQKNLSNVVSMRLYGEEYNVYTISYSCYGVVDTYNRYLSILAKNPDRTDTIEHPCAPKGLELKHNASFLFNEPCTTTPQHQLWIAQNPTKLNKTYTFKGSGNVAECKKVMSEVYENCKDFNECYRPLDSSVRLDTVMAFSGFYFTTLFFNSTNTILTTLQNFTTIVDGFCSMNWEDAEIITTPGADASFTFRYCFQGQAITHLLTKGYGFNDTSWPNIEFTKEVKKTSLGWSLGYMINATNAIPAEARNPPVISLPWFIVVLVVSIGLCILFVVFFNHNRRSTTKSSVPA